jgi:hypothetical protein
MAYGDRMALSIKEFGRKVVITVNRGHIKELPKARKITILYPDDETRNRKLQKPKPTQPRRRILPTVPV